MKLFIIAHRLQHLLTFLWSTFNKMKEKVLPVLKGNDASSATEYWQAEVLCFSPWNLQLRYHKTAESHTPLFTLWRPSVSKVRTVNAFLSFTHGEWRRGDLLVSLMCWILMFTTLLCSSLEESAATKTHHHWECHCNSMHAW